MTFTLINEPYVLERVPAWVECNANNCQSHREAHCPGGAGHWHEALIQHNCYAYMPPLGPMSRPVTKQSYLTRKWSVCKRCQGRKEMDIPPSPCIYCLKDTDGEPTAAGHPISEWEVE